MDFTGTLNQMDVTDLDRYRPLCPGGDHLRLRPFNSWPVTVDPEAIGGGMVDRLGRRRPAWISHNTPATAQPGTDLPGIPVDPRDNLVQINHITAHFGCRGPGIDTGKTPPQSSGPAPMTPGPQPGQQL